MSENTAGRAGKEKRPSRRRRGTRSNDLPYTPSMHDVYRRAASVLVLRPATGSDSDFGFRILLLHKPRKKDAWQLPQGGMEEGESVAEAAMRELKEEAGLTGCRALGMSGRVYQYDFPPSFRRFRPDNVKGQRIEFVFALASPDAAVGVDGREVNGHAWVCSAHLGRYIKRREYLDLVQGLYEETMHDIAKRKVMEA